MTTTLKQLQTKYPANYIHLEVLLQDHFTHIKNHKYFLKKVREGKIKIKVNHLTESRRSPHIIYLTDLAAYLDNRQQQTSNS